VALDVVAVINEFKSEKLSNVKYFFVPLLLNLILAATSTSPTLFSILSHHSHLQHTRRQAFVLGSHHLPPPWVPK
jgi:hypothetical protein